MAKTSPPTGAVIIPHYNDVARLMRCLDALMPQLVADVEIVVADNGSTQSLALVKETYPALRIVTEPKQGAAAARNRAVAETTARWLFFLDADCVPANDWVARALHHAHAATSAADIIGGRVDLFDETPAPRSGAEVVETVFAFKCRDYVEREGFSVTANMLTRRDVFDATGPFAAGTSEDCDWCHRAGLNGYSIIYDDDLIVSHPTRSDWNALQRKFRRVTIERFVFQQSINPGRGKWMLRAFATLASGVVHAPHILVRGDMTLNERLRGVGTLLRIRALRAVWMIRQAAGGSI